MERKQSIVCPNCITDLKAKSGKLCCLKCGYWESEPNEGIELIMFRERVIKAGMHGNIFHSQKEMGY